MVYIFVPFERVLPQQQLCTIFFSENLPDLSSSYIIPNLCGLGLCHSTYEREEMLLKRADNYDREEIT